MYQNMHTRLVTSTMESMSISFFAGLADLSFLAVFLFWIAAEQTQVSIEELHLPEARFAVIAQDDLGPDTQILNMRSFRAGEIPQAVKEQYAAAGLGSMLPDNYSFTDVIWNGEILYPISQPDPYPHLNRVFCPYPYWKLVETAREWPKDSPVIVRAGRFTPMTRISSIASALNRDDLPGFDVHLAVIDGGQL